LYFVVRVQCRRKESSRSLSHLMMSFLLQLININTCERDQLILSPNALVARFLNIRCNSTVDHFAVTSITKAGEATSTKQKLLKFILPLFSILITVSQLHSFTVMFAVQLLRLYDSINITLLQPIQYSYFIDSLHLKYLAEILYRRMKKLKLTIPEFLTAFKPTYKP